MKIVLITAALAAIWNSAAAQPIVVSQQAWEGLSAEERSVIQRNHIVDARDGSTVGEIIDAQGIDETTPGTNGGAALGAAIGNAAYIDRALKPDNNYSAKTQLAAILLGAAIGSTLDKPTEPKYRFRYAVRTKSKEIEYREITQTEPFRHPPGICLDLNSLEKIPQSACIFHPDGLRERYLPKSSKANTAPLEPLQTYKYNEDEKKSPDGLIQCKPKDLAAITTTRDKCEIINGEIL